MPNHLSHFAINADDLPRARRFYEKVFGWQFEPWGPPGFYLLHTGTPQNPGIQGALQQRRDLLPGQRMTGYECTIGVESADAIASGSCASSESSPSGTSNRSTGTGTGFRRPTRSLESSGASRRGRSPAPSWRRLFGEQFSRSERCRIT